MALSLRLRVALQVALFATTIPAVAANMSFLKDSPISRFNDKDMQLFTQALNEALSKGADGETRNWSNPATGAGGEIKTESSYAQGATPCRKVVISNSAKGLSASGPFNFCKQSTGKWAPAAQ
jgi:surface antigen